MGRMIRKIVVRWMFKGTMWGALRWGFTRWRDYTIRDIKEEVRKGRLVSEEERDRERRERGEMVR